MEGDRRQGEEVVGVEKGEERGGGQGAEEESRRRKTEERGKAIRTRVVLGGDRERNRDRQRDGERATETEMEK